MKAARRVGIQYAALPWRLAGRQVQVLLITSRGTQRWVIPKGWPIRGLKPQDAAAIEASEEAGIVGEVEEIPIGSYAYVKQLTPKRAADVQVIVFAFRVSYQAPDWKERGERRFAWWPHQKAAQLVAEPGLRRLILDFGAARTPTLLAQSLWRYRTWRLAARG
jgi:8-oxo-dGTP pyrophosphatase MutT (NUDIX family)